ELKQMQAISAEAPGFTAIGFQWSFAASTARLKQAIAAGRFGAPVSLHTLVLWPRNREYYQRSDWVGRRADDAGRPVNDNPVANATAHFIHHCLFLLGPAPNAAATPSRVAGEPYRANPIETYDAAALRLDTTAGVPIHFATAHTCSAEIGPLIRYRFEQADIHYLRGGAGFVARYHDGRCEAFGDPEDEAHQKLWAAAASVREGSLPACPLAAATPHMRLVDTLARQTVHQIDPPATRTGRWRGVEQVQVHELDAAWIQSYASARLPHELGVVGWAAPGFSAPVTPL
ncbi:MAG: Gfo/Idh/MocA family protein, partial [Planctomycetota bacterium]